jgi:formate hydrogenlyase transcriptional activator
MQERQVDASRGNPDGDDLRRGINDLVSLLALPAIWTGGDASLVVTTLLDVLVPMLHLDFAYLRLTNLAGASPNEWARLGERLGEGIRPQQIGEALRPFLADDTQAVDLRVANPLGEGTVSIAILRLGLADGAGQLVAGSRRSDFPTDIELLALQVAANQAAMALQERRQVTKLRRAAGELELRVAARTEELTAVNRALRKEVIERERGERALADTEDRLREMADNIPEVVWITTFDPEQRVVYASPSFERVWGKPLGELYRNPRLWIESIHPEDRARVADAFSRWIAGLDGYEDVEFRIVHPDGSIRWVHEHGVLTVDEQGKPLRASGISTDITDRKKAEQELERAFAEIQALKDRLHQENIALREEVEKTSMFEEVVGVSAQLKAVLGQVARVAPTDSTVLITGETGTGKELIARAIHKLSLRSACALVSVNCAAIPPSLIASELFGHEKGAFTGALQRRQGRFELADGGTIFLDEVGELPAETQVTLLRVLQEREFERVGGNRPVRTDVRVIAASNRDLEAAVAQNAFRADLFYRLNVFPLEMPALRERRADIPVLVEYFIHRYARRAGKKIRGISKASLDLLRSYDWPGNVRELQNVVERAVIVSDSETLSIDERGLSGRPGAVPVSASAPLQTLATREKGAIEDALEETRGRVAGPFGAAARLGIPSSTLESKIRALKIDKKRFKAAPPPSLR